MKRIALLLAFVAVITGFAAPPTNATTPERMSYNNAFVGALLTSGSFTRMASGAYRRNLLFAAPPNRMSYQAG